VTEITPEMGHAAGLHLRKLVVERGTGLDDFSAHLDLWESELACLTRGHRWTAERIESLAKFYGVEPGDFTRITAPIDPDAMPRHRSLRRAERRESSIGMLVGSRVQRARATYGIEAAEMADVLGVTVDELAAMKNGAEWSAHHVTAVADRFKRTPTDVMGTTPTVAARAVFCTDREFMANARRVDVAWIPMELAMIERMGAPPILEMWLREDVGVVHIKIGQVSGRYDHPHWTWCADPVAYIVGRVRAALPNWHR